MTLFANPKKSLSHSLNLFRVSNLAVAALTLALFVPGVISAPAAAQVQYTTKHIYSETADPKADIAAALKEARKDHKRVLLDFGGDWCGDCQVLDIYFHQAPNAELLNTSYILVHVWIGRMDHNLDIPEKYGVPINKGVPALAVLNARGEVLYSQKTGEFEDMRHMDASSVTSFLEKWKP
jgi:thiol:disulfide interchange protein